MTSTSLRLYEQEVFQFLRTVTIKFTPISDAYNRNLEFTYGVDRSRPETWKYYLNMTGEYHASDTIMTVHSFDTQEVIEFTKNNLITHPKTAAAYRVGTSEYEDLIQKYPQQRDLIKSIVYPVLGIEAAIAADNFEILAYGTGYLEPDELEVILFEMRRFLSYVADRWYLKSLAYEPYFNVGFWGELFQQLILVIHNARFKYVHTHSAHSFHIWEYLTSNGLGDYRDILNRKQTMFLYRNMRYLQDNKGKQSTLELLTNNLLGEIGVALIGKVIYQDTGRAAAECRWVPELVPDTVQTDDSESVRDIPPQSITDITYRLVAEGLDNDLSQEYIDRTERRIGSTKLNMLPTKLLEIRQLGRDTKYNGVLNNFILDTLVYMVSTGLYAPAVNFTDSRSGTAISLTGQDALVLYYFCIHKADGATPTTLPKVYSPQYAFQKNISAENIPNTFVYNEVKYDVLSHVPLEALVENTAYPTKVIQESSEFDTFLAERFATRLNHIRYYRKTGDVLQIRAYRAAYPHIYQTHPYSLELSPHQTYDAWLQDPLHPYAQLVSVYDSSGSPSEYYTGLANDIITQLIPLNHPSFSKYVSNSDERTKWYKRLKALFVQLCSYQVLFMDTKEDDPSWLLFSKITMHQSAVTYSDVTELLHEDIRVNDGGIVVTEHEAVTTYTKLDPEDSVLSTEDRILASIPMSISGDSRYVIDVDQMLGQRLQSAMITDTTPVAASVAVSVSDDNITYID